MTTSTTATHVDDRRLQSHADIADRKDIAALLRDFYGRAFRDELLGPVLSTSPGWISTRTCR